MLSFTGLKKLGDLSRKCTNFPIHSPNFVSSSQCALLTDGERDLQLDLRTGMQIIANAVNIFIEAGALQHLLGNIVGV